MEETTWTTVSNPVVIKTGLIHIPDKSFHILKDMVDSLTQGNGVTNGEFYDTRKEARIIGSQVRSRLVFEDFNYRNLYVLDGFMQNKMKYYFVLSWWPSRIRT